MSSVFAVQLALNGLALLAAATTATSAVLIVRARAQRVRAQAGRELRHNARLLRRRAGDRHDLTFLADNLEAAADLIDPRETDTQ